MDPVAGSIFDNVLAGIAGIEVPTAIGTGNEGMESVVMIPAAKSRQEDLLLIRPIITVRIRVDDHMWRGRNDDLVTDHRNTQRCKQVLVLDKDLGTIASAITIGILENHDPLASLARHPILGRVTEVSVVDGLGHPQPSAVIDIDRCWIVELRRTRPQSHLQAIGHGEQRRHIGTRLGLLRGQDSR